FANAAKEGKKPIDAVQDLITQIQKAKSPSDATAIAIKHLGVRAGAEFANAVKTGAFGLDDLEQSFHGLTIDQTAKATATLSDKFKMFKNQALVAIQPYATKFLDFLNYLVDHKPILVAIIATITAGFVALGVAMVATAIAAAPIGAAFAL